VKVNKKPIVMVDQFTDALLFEMFDRAMSADNVQALYDFADGTMPLVVKAFEKVKKNPAGPQTGMWRLMTLVTTAVASRANEMADAHESTLDDVVTALNLAKDTMTKHRKNIHRIIALLKAMQGTLEGHAVDIARSLAQTRANEERITALEQQVASLQHELRALAVGNTNT